MSETGSTPRVVVVGAGAAGTLTRHPPGPGRDAAREPARRRRHRPRADRCGRGVAFGTPRRAPAQRPGLRMSALPEDPGHFVAWLGRQGDGAHAIRTRSLPDREFARYLDETLDPRLAAAEGWSRVRHVRGPATGGIRRHRVGGPHHAGTLGRRATRSWWPRACRRWAALGALDAHRLSVFVPDPWAAGALDVVRRDRTGPADVLVVGTGLTMVDVVLSLSGEENRPDRRLHAVSRTGGSRVRTPGRAEAGRIPDITDWGDDLDTLVERSART